MKRIRIAPSILAWDLGDLKGAVDISDRGGADQVHLDVIDGHFAPNITFGPGTVKALRKLTDLKFDTHLMTENPGQYVEKFLEAGSDILTFHAEILTKEKFDELYSIVKRQGKETGIALKPGTEIPSWVRERLDKLTALVVMTVNPGFSGQTMDFAVLPKLQRIAQIIEEEGSPVDIEIDGGVEPENVHEVVKRGGNVLVAGAGVFSKKDPVRAISALRERAEMSRGKE